MTTSRLVLLFLPVAVFAQSRPGSVDQAFEKFWAADSPKSAAHATDDIAKSGVTFDEALRRLKVGRTYTAQKSGVIQLMNLTDDGVEHYYAVNVPPASDPARKYQVRFQLHGGIGGRQDNTPRGTGEIGALAGAEQIYVLPYAWDAAPWWGDDQVMNLDAILDSLKRTYNIDENRVVLSGVSDGATGGYFIIMRDTTPFASFTPLNGFIMVLANGRIDDSRIFPNNLLNKPMYVVNGGLDRLYPISIVEPYTKHFMQGGVAIDYHPRREAGHNTRWWPELKDSYEQFVASHPRNPDPDRLTWEAGNAEHNRAHWVVLDEFGAAKGEAKSLPDLNVLEGGEEIFADRRGGRVDLVRTGNTVKADTHGVTAFTLLLSPDHFDLQQPVKVIANGREVFGARVQPSLATLLKWAARDNDRTMLYAAEIKIRLPR